MVSLLSAGEKNQYNRKQEEGGFHVEAAGEERGKGGMMESIFLIIAARVKELNTSSLASTEDKPRFGLFCHMATNSMSSLRWQIQVS